MSNALKSQNIDSFNPDLNSVLGEMEEEHYLFIVADLKKATLILFKQGAVEDIKEIIDPSVNKKIKSNTGEMSGRSTKYDHKIDNQIKKHLQLIARQASAMIAGKHINGLFLGGHKTMFAAITQVLPADLQKKIRSEFITELNISREELINHCAKALSSYLKE